jgi:hypothetical protein
MCIDALVTSSNETIEKINAQNEIWTRSYFEYEQENVEIAATIDENKSLIDKLHSISREIQAHQETSIRIEKEIQRMRGTTNELNETYANAKQREAGLRELLSSKQYDLSLREQKIIELEEHLTSKRSEHDHLQYRLVELKSVNVNSTDVSIALEVELENKRVESNKLQHQLEFLKMTKANLEHTISMEQAQVESFKRLHEESMVREHALRKEIHELREETMRMTIKVEKIRTNTQGSSQAIPFSDQTMMSMIARKKELEMMKAAVFTEVSDAKARQEKLKQQKAIIVAEYVKLANARVANPLSTSFLPSGATAEITRQDAESNVLARTDTLPSMQELRLLATWFNEPGFFSSPCPVVLSRLSTGALRNEIKELQLMQQVISQSAEAKTKLEAEISSLEKSLEQVQIETGAPVNAHPTYVAISTSGNRRMTLEQDAQRIEAESLNTELANTGNILRDLQIEFNEAVEELKGGNVQGKSNKNKAKSEVKRVHETPQQKSPGARNYLSSAGLDDLSDDEEEKPPVVVVLRKRKAPTSPGQ